MERREAIMNRSKIELTLVKTQLEEEFVDVPRLRNKLEKVEVRLEELLSAICEGPQTDDTERVIDEISSVTNDLEKLAAKLAKIESERLAHEKNLESERLAREKNLEAERLANEKREESERNLKLEKEKLDVQFRLEQQKLDLQRVELERSTKDQQKAREIETLRMEADRAAALEQQRLESQRIELDRQKVEFDRQKAEADSQKAEADRIALERKENAEREAEERKQEADRLSKEADREFQLREQKLQLDAQKERKDADRQANLEIQKIKAELEFQRLKNAEKKELLKVEAAKVSGEKLTQLGVQHKIGNVLPKLNVPSFAGSPTTWLNFRDLFKALIVDNAGLNSSQKLQYLKMALRDQALDLISSLPPTENNFDIAWSLLEERYSSPRDLVVAYIQRLLDLPNLKDESADSLRKLVDGTKEILRSLELLERTPKMGNDIIVHLITQRLHSETRRDWTLTFKSKSPPELDDLLQFLEKRAEAFTSMGIKTTADVTKSQGKKEDKKNPNKQQRAKFTATAAVKQTPRNNNKSRKCSYCQADSHFIFGCNNFKNLTISQRHNWVKQNKHCFICLHATHFSNSCTSKRNCAVCARRHNTLLHSDPAPPVNYTQYSQAVDCSEQQQLISALNPASPTFTPHISACTTNPELNSSKRKETLLFTAQILVKSRNGTFLPCRALIDPGSMSSLISEASSRELWLPRKNSDISVLGINGSTPQKNLGAVTLNIKSCISDYSCITDAIVLGKLTSNLPTEKIEIRHWPHLDGLPLADRQFNHPGKIDIILGQDMFNAVMLGERKIGRLYEPVAYNSHLGWLLGGSIPVNTQRNNNTTLAYHSTNHILQRFWEVDKLPDAETSLKSSDRWAESHFTATHKRLDNGSYQVDLPLVKDRSTLGSTKYCALKRLQSVEKRLSTNPELKKQYHAFMTEYEELNHMRKLDGHDVTGRECFIPHHAVIKPDSLTTKVRVVFDGSAKSDNGTSLNDLMITGPTVQPELFDTLINFRRYKYAISADIVKMYRAFLVNPDDRELQCILWRTDPSMEPDIYQLQTVTYGLRPSAFLATRCLNQLASDYDAQYPAAARALRSETYVDDLLSGGNTAMEVHTLVSELIDITSAANLKFQKWCTNEVELLTDFYECDIERNGLSLDNDDFLKILGVVWTPASDVFSFRVNSLSVQEPLTKRQLVSNLAKVFDPLGLLVPLTIWAKILIQGLWKIELSWDEPIPHVFSSAWQSFLEQVHLLSSVQVPRFIGDPSSGSLFLFGFCDASRSAYAACVYAQFPSPSGLSSVLVAAKSRVAPVQALSIPRLELSGALLLAKLINRIRSVLAVPQDHVKLFSDSQVVLSWLVAPPATSNVFVMNRVAEIQRTVDTIPWYFVSGLQNPADLGTRGILPSSLVNNELWFYGPEFITDPDHDFSTMVFRPTETFPEIPSVSVNTNVVDSSVQFLNNNIECNVNSVIVNVSVAHSNLVLFKLCADWRRLQRITAYVLRFISNSRSHYGPKFSGPLDLTELETASALQIRNIQLEHFPEEFSACVMGKQVSPKSKLSGLCPKLGPQKLLIVQGRLSHAPISESAKQPIILPRRSGLTQSIVTAVHLRRFHSGPALTLSILRSQYWILGGLAAVKSILRNCVTCARYRTNVTTQLMGPLPPCRVYANPPFFCTGTDFCGPFSVTPFKKRGVTSIKSYIAIFICMSSKAVHLELVSGLSSSDFINAFRRFVSRRGLCKILYSDHGTNFVGAKGELRKVLRSALAQSSEDVQRQLAADGVEWRFTPVESPHFGGIWESNIKSIKKHLVKVSTSQMWTVEQLTTILCEIEACLNSRPLVPLTSNPDDLGALTPAHLLIGRPLTTVPLSQDPQTSPLNSYRILAAQVRFFWNRWKTEYLATLLSRPKWRLRRSLVKIGDMVIIRDKLTPPCYWRLGRVIGVLPGQDNLNRVITIRTQAGLIQRAIRNVIVLFNENDA